MKQEKMGENRSGFTEITNKPNLSNVNLFPPNSSERANGLTPRTLGSCLMTLNFYFTSVEILRIPFFYVDKFVLARLEIGMRLVCVRYERS